MHSERNIERSKRKEICRLQMALKHTHLADVYLDVILPFQDPVVFVENDLKVVVALRPLFDRQHKC
jgi:hypothetical protein